MCAGSYLDELGAIAEAVLELYIQVHKRLKDWGLGAVREATSMS